MVRRTKGLAFYLWGFGLVLSVGQTCRFLVDSPVGIHLKWMLSLVSLFACALQFFMGKNIGAVYGECIVGVKTDGECEFCFACIHNCPQKAIVFKQMKEVNPNARYRNEHVSLYSIKEANSSIRSL